MHAWSAGVAIATPAVVVDNELRPKQLHNLLHQLPRLPSHPLRNLAHLSQRIPSHNIRIRFEHSLGIPKHAVATTFASVDVLEPHQKILPTGLVDVCADQRSPVLDAPLDHGLRVEISDDVLEFVFLVEDVESFATDLFAGSEETAVGAVA